MQVMEPGLKQHNLIDLSECRSHIAEVLEAIDGDFKWLDEILAECKKTFSSPTISLLPKTPSQKKPPRRRVRRRLTDDLEALNERVPDTVQEDPAPSETPVRHLRSTRSRKAQLTAPSKVTCNSRTAAAAKKIKENASPKVQETGKITLPVVSESSTPQASAAIASASGSESDQTRAGVREKARAYETMLTQRNHGSPITPKSSGKGTPKSTGSATPKSTAQRKSSHSGKKTDSASHGEIKSVQHDAHDSDIINTSQHTRRSSKFHETALKRKSIKVLGSKARLRSLHVRLSRTGPLATSVKQADHNSVQLESEDKQYDQNLPSEKESDVLKTQTQEPENEKADDSEPKGRAPRTRLRLNKNNKTATESSDSLNDTAVETESNEKETLFAQPVEQDDKSTQASTRTKRKKQKSLSSDEEAPDYKVMKEDTEKDNEPEVRTRTRTRIMKAAPEPSKEESLSKSDDQAADTQTVSTFNAEFTSTQGQTRTRTRARKVEAKEVAAVKESSFEDAADTEGSVFEYPAASTKPIIDEKVDELTVKSSSRGDSGIGKSTSDNIYETITRSSMPVASSIETNADGQKVEVLRRETHVISKMASETEQEEEERPARSTRTKARHMQDKSEDSDAAGKMQQQEAEETRMTRTKTRKRKAEEEAADMSVSKKSHTETPPKGDHDMDENKTRGSDKDSDFEDIDDMSEPSTQVKRPVPSFLNQLRKSSLSRSTHVVSGVVTSFLKRNTPPRKTNQQNAQEQKKKELQEKEKRDQERLNRLDAMRRDRADEQKRKREERMRKVAEMREMRQKKEEKLKKTLAEKLKERLNSTEKMKEDKYREEREKQRQRLKRQLDADDRRKQEEEQRLKKIIEQQEQQKFNDELTQRRREQEEQERLQRQKEERRRQEERLAEAERKRQEEVEKLRQQEMERELEKQKEREQRDKAAAQVRAERVRLELERKKEQEEKMQKELEKLRELELERIARMAAHDEEKRREDAKLQQIIEHHNRNLQNLAINATLTLCSNTSKPNTAAATSVVVPRPLTKTQPNPDSYPISPVRKKKNSSIENYDISDLKSDDSTDDDDNPRKKIPAWAQGANFKAMLINQEYNPPNLDVIFGIIEPPDLNTMFAAKRPRFNKRTSSAVWNSPLHKTH